MNARSVLSVVAAAAVALPGLAVARDLLLPEPRTVGNIVYRSGGIGEDERTALRALSADYNLRLSFIAEGRGAYLSGVRVRIENQEGKPMLNAQADGPWFFARLPAGRYRIAATLAGDTVSRDVDVTKGTAELVLRWKMAAAN